MDRSNENSVSLNKFISGTGFCSRREADKLIEAGKVSINGKRARLGNRVFNGDSVRVNGKKVSTHKKRDLYIAFNKPRGIVCTTDPKERKNIISYINHRQRLFPIGRLDKDSQGLIFLTNDGDIVNKILRAGNNHEKEYRVFVDKKITDEFVLKMSGRVPILGTKTRECLVERLGDYSFRIILTEGMNRQIRRMCEYFGYEVKRLIRLRIMNVKLGNLKQGKWRELTNNEMHLINKATSKSLKTQDASSKKERHKR